jgi:hypothetical protein
MSKDPESVPFVRRVLQISQTDERWFTFTRNATVVDQYTYSRFFTWVRQAIDYRLFLSTYTLSWSVLVFEPYKIAQDDISSFYPTCCAHSRIASQFR